MRTTALLGCFPAAGLAAAALAGCVTARGPTYPETLTALGALGPNDARIVFLRPDQRYDDASLSRVVVRIDDRVLGKLAYGGFLLKAVPAGSVVLEVSADNRFLFGTCLLDLEVTAGQTLYFDVSPRPASVAAGAIGAVAGGAVAGGVVATPAQTAAGASAGAIAGSATEGQRRPCGGPYRMKPLDPAIALGHLERLRASE